jgi:hypothetical protein
MPHRHPRRDDDDFDDDRPRRPRGRSHAGKPKKKGTPVALIVGLVVGGIVLLGGGSLAAFFLLRDKSTGAAAPQDPFPGMLAHWSFDDYQVDDARQVINVQDSTGRGNNGVATGGRIAPGKKGNALWLDGRDDQYMDVSGAKDLNFAPGSELTIAAWFTTRDKYGGTIVAFRHPTLPTQLDIYSRDNRVIGIIGDDEDDGEHAFKWDPAPTASDGQWHHVALTRRGKFVALYYDGVSQGEDARANSGGRLSGGLGAVGCNLRFVKDDERRFGRHGFKGGIDEVYVFSRALTGPEIQALMRR